MKTIQEQYGFSRMTDLHFYQMRKAVMDLWIEELKNNYSSFSSEHDGVLRLGIDDRAGIMSAYIKPILDGYDRFVDELEKDKEPFPNSADQGYIEEFENRAYVILTHLEESIRDEVIGFLKIARDSR